LKNENQPDEFNPFPLYLQGKPIPCASDFFSCASVSNPMRIRLKFPAQGIFFPAQETG
jgi:hypothetical protein